MPDRTTLSGTFVARHAESQVRTALTDTRIVALVGPRQSGKTTLARRIAQRDDRPFITLDDDQFRRFAQDDPAGFMRGRQTAVIDEIQRAPGLILALKKAVDDDPRPGRFLITGSVELFKGAVSPDSLAGRVETVELLPFSQAEIAGVGPAGNFLKGPFAGDFPATASMSPTADLIQRVRLRRLSRSPCPAPSRPAGRPGCAPMRAPLRSAMFPISPRSASSPKWPF